MSVLLFGGARPSILPSQATGTLWVWSDANDSTKTLDAGGAAADPDEAVRTWAPTGGSVNWVGSAGLDPLRRAAYYNGLSVLEFDTTNNNMAANTVVGINTTTVNIFSVAKCVESSATSFIGPYFYSGVPGFCLYADTTGATCHMYNYNGSGVISSKSYANPNGWHAYYGRMVSNNLYSAVDSFTDSSLSAPQATTATNPAITTGSIGNTFGNYTNSFIGEVIIYTTDLSESNRVLVGNYLLNKWGL
jgi:hypothetical protein